MKGHCALHTKITKTILVFSWSNLSRCQIHVRNLQLLMTEIYKTKCGLNPPFMKEIFMQRNIGYSLRHGDDAQLPKVRTTSFGVESIAYLGNKLCQILPQEIKQSNSLPIFKKTN